VLLDGSGRHHVLPPITTGARQIETHAPGRKAVRYVTTDIAVLLPTGWGENHLGKGCRFVAYAQVGIAHFPPIDRSGVRDDQPSGRALLRLFSLFEQHAARSR
jgi:hypothetical protein